MQTFRNYREVFDKQKLAIEHRYRQLLDDAIQDAVFLSSRNNELTIENSALQTGNILLILSQVTVLFLAECGVLNLM